MDSFFDECMNRIEEEISGFLDEAMEDTGQRREFACGFRMTTGANGEPSMEGYVNTTGGNDLGDYEKRSAY